MKITILHRYFWPQPYPYAQMLKDIVETFSTNSEHTVSVLTTDSGDIEERNRRSDWAKKTSISMDALTLGTEKRASLFKKGFNSVYFGAWVVYRLLTTNTDVVMVATTPPVIVAMLVRWVSYFKKFKYVYHCQDIHPEGMLLGENITNGLIYNTLKSIDKKNIDKAWKVITLSEDMKATLKRRGCHVDHVHIINNFIFNNDNYIRNSNPNDKIHFLFAGSLGRLQNLSILMDALVLLNHRTDIQFTFMGDGVMYNHMQSTKEKHKLKNVEFLGQRSLEEAIKAMQNADIGIVSIGNNIAQVAYPSKTMMYLGNGLPVLALVNEDTEIFHFINKHNIGLAIDPASANNIAEAIELFVDAFKQSPFDNSHVKRLAEEFFGKKATLLKFRSIYA